jgi:hypothetical protein
LNAYAQEPANHRNLGQAPDLTWSQFLLNEEVGQSCGASFCDTGDALMPSELIVDFEFVALDGNAESIGSRCYRAICRSTRRI